MSQPRPSNLRSMKRIAPEDVALIADGVSITASGGYLSVKDAGITNAKLTGSFLKIGLAAGTASGANVTVADMAVGDELVTVLSFETAASIETVADRTSEYEIGDGHLTKAAGTSETGNQLLICYLDLT